MGKKKIRVLLFCLSFLLESFLSFARAQTIFLKDVRFSASPQKFRMVMDLTGAPEYKAQLQDNVLSIELEGTQLEWNPENIQTGDASVNKIETQHAPEQEHLTFKVYCAYPMPFRIFRLANPDRLVVDMMKQFDEKIILFLDSFVEFNEARKSSASGLLSYTLLRFSPSHDPFKLVPALANSIFSREKLSSFVQNSGAVAGINGGFFSKEGKPLGLIAIDGDVHTENLYHRSCLVEKNNGQFAVENIEVEIFARGENGQTLKLNGLNRERKDHEIILFTPAFGNSTRTNMWGAEYLVIDGIVQEKDAAENNTTIPEKGFVISTGAKRADAALFFETGKKIQIEFSLNPSNDFKNVICAGPRLLKNGAVFVTSKEEQFKPDVAAGDAPRTALGITKDGEIIMVVVDGRNAQKSRGVTLQELAHLMQELGAYNALNLDGGGSSTMVVGNMVVNSPSDGTERKVATALLLLYKNSPSGNNDFAWFSELFLREPVPIQIFSEGR